MLFEGYTMMGLSSLCTIKRCCLPWKSLHSSIFVETLNHFKRMDSLYTAWRRAWLVEGASQKQYMREGERGREGERERGD